MGRLNLPHPFQDASGLKPDADGAVSLIDAGGKTLARVPLNTAFELSPGTAGCSSGPGYSYGHGDCSGESYGYAYDSGDGYGHGHRYGFGDGRGVGYGDGLPNGSGGNK